MKRPGRLRAWLRYRRQRRASRNLWVFEYLNMGEPPYIHLPPGPAMTLALRWERLRIKAGDMGDDGWMFTA